MLSLLSALVFSLIIGQTHPMAFSLFLLLMSLLVSLWLMLSTTVWMGLGLSLIFMGGMMVIILYVSALVGESKFFASSSMLALALLLGVGLSSSLPSSLSTLAQIPLFAFYLSFSVYVLAFLTLYLLLTLVLAVIISEAHNGPITQWN